MADLQSRLDLTLSDFPYIDGFLPTVADLVALNIVKEQDLEGKHHLKRWYKHINTFSQDDKNKFSHALTSDFAKYLLNSRPLVYVMSPKESTIDLIDDLPQLVLSELDANSQGFNTIHMAAKLSIDHQKLIGVIKSLLAQEGVISTEDMTEKRLELSSEGRELAKNGSHEFNVYQAIGENGLLQDDLKKLSFGKLGMNKAMAAGWIMIDKVTGKVVRKVQSDSVVDSVRQKLEALARGETVDEKTKADLKKRKLVNEITVKSLYVKRGLQFTTDIKKLEADLTPEMIASGSWKTTTFKKYNFNALGIQPACGHLHPLMKVRSEFRQIFFSMGFSEMPTNRYVESCFWNFDALFQPQQHPARDAHDTFFISDPAISTVFPSEYLERVKTVHSNGGYGSIGYNYDWKLEEAQKNVLRTHTTAVSARQLYKLAQQILSYAYHQGFKPTKMFSIDRVFRNETLDATHLAEFHQVEGVIAERNLSLSHLIGVFTEFFRKLGIEGLRFKPAYNPYTEPSMEIFAYHKGLKKWVEIGNSGMFRPEMLLPMGIPPDVNVAGYGLSLERPTMIRYGIDNIREMFGPKVDLEMVYSGPICRLDKKLADK